jgi:hypothetical protein
MTYALLGNGIWNRFADTEPILCRGCDRSEIGVGVVLAFLTVLEGFPVPYRRETEISTSINAPAW